MNASQTHLSSTARAREGSLGLPSPTLWPSASSPGLQPSKTISRRSSARSLFRQPSPDPWATEFSQNRLSLPAAVHNGSTDQLPFSALEKHEEEPEQTAPDTIQDATKSTDTHVEEPAAQPVAEHESEGRDANAQNNSHSPTLSRNSSLSDDSHHDDRPPESPITSMDEDAKDRPTVQRRPSAKVQDLVQMYDGLAKKKSQTLLTPDTASGRQRSASRSTSIRSGTTDDVSDFGDFEDAQEEDAIPPSRKPSLGGSPRRPSSRAGRVRSLSRISLRTSTAPPSLTAPSPIIEEVSNKFNELREKFGPATFDVNLESVDKLFDVEKLHREQPSAKDYSLDAIEGIIKDSFSTVSERKTWYRISRPGTLRKHDLGDDENYRRVTWAGSKVREDVTTTVRRWMEESSYGGRPAIGGGSTAKSGGFNWDAKSKAEPLSFDQIFGKRKSVQPVKPVAAPLPRPLSLQPEPKVLGHSRDTSVGGKSLPPRSPLSIPEPPPGPAFGWSTGATGMSSTPTSSRPSGQFNRQSIDVHSIKSGLSRTPSIHETESRSSMQLAPPPTTRATLETPASALTPALTIADVDDDDEEWGDMVASPAAESRPTSMLFENSLNGSMASLHDQFDEAPAPKHGALAILNDSLNGSVSSLHNQFAESPVPRSTATPVLHAVTSKLESAQGTSKETPAASATSLDIWDLSAFDSAPAAPSILPTLTPKPESDLETPLQSPTASVSSRTGSPLSFPLSKPPASPAPARAESPSLLQPSKSPTPPVPFRPQHGQQRSKSSLNLVRPSPLHNVITPKAPESPVPATPKAAETTKTVSFASQSEDCEVSEEDAALIQQIVRGLPDLSYMNR